MSAAEKLRELGALRGPEWTGRWLDLDGKWINVNTVIAVTNALSQIVAVVEAAEEIAEFMAARCKEGDTEYQVVLLARPALDALDEALS